MEPANAVKDIAPTVRKLRIRHVRLQSTMVPHRRYLISKLEDSDPPLASGLLWCRAKVLRWVVVFNRGGFCTIVHTIHYVIFIFFLDQLKASKRAPFLVLGTKAALVLVLGSTGPLTLAIQYITACRQGRCHG